MATKKKSKANAKKKLDRKPKNIKAKKVVKVVAQKQTAKIAAKPAVKTVAVAVMPSLPVSIPAMKPRPLTKQVARPKTKVKVKPQYTPLTSEERRILRSTPPQFTYMNAPAAEHEFQVGDTVEVFCDHEKAGDRVRGWVKGIVVQVDNKLVAVQFRSNVFLTDGWMVPDRILWYPLMSDQIRDATYAKKGSRKEVPDY
ncbi:MAG: hypothetical protein WBW94_00610 [Anaerolineales bacterium]